MESIYYALNPWWEGRDFETGITREPYVCNFDTFLQRKQVEIFIGSRRIGKTTLLRQIIKKLLETVASQRDIFYLALDHPALSGVTISGHLKNMRKMFLHDRDKRLYLFLDEIQA